MNQQKRSVLEYCDFGHCHCLHRSDGHCDPKTLGEDCEVGETSKECEAFWKGVEASRMKVC